MKGSEAGSLKEIQRFADTRQREHGDLYGWSILARDLPTVLLYVSREARTESFPRHIGAFRVVLKHVAPPHPQGTTGVVIGSSRDV